MTRPTQAQRTLVTNLPKGAHVPDCARSLTPTRSEYSGCLGCSAQVMLDWVPYSDALARKWYVDAAAHAQALLVMIKDEPFDYTKLANAAGAAWDEAGGMT